ncbi:MAG: hypothetical protein MJZ81_11440 [Bacteroidales bacterium]|nr:hypothetical protein [Bacteroidales bacterium]
MFDKDFKDSLVSFDGPNGTLVEVSAMEIAGCYGLPVTPKEERSKKGGIGIFGKAKADDCVPPERIVGAVILRSGHSVVTDHDYLDVSETVRAIIRERAESVSGRSKSRSDDVAAILKIANDAREDAAECRATKEKVSELEKRLDELSKSIDGEVSKAKSDFDAYWHNRLRPWFAELKTNERKYLKLAEEASGLESRIETIEKMFTPVDVPPDSPTMGVELTTLCESAGADSASQPSLFDQEDVGGTADNLEQTECVDAAKVAETCSSEVNDAEVVAKARAESENVRNDKKRHELNVAEFDATRPDAFPLLMTTYEEAVSRIGKLWRTSASSNGTLRYNEFLWAIGYVDTASDDDIGWLRNKRAYYSSQIAKFITEKCGVEIVKFQKRIKFSDATEIASQLKHIGCFTGSTEHAVHLSEGSPRRKRVTPSE